LRCRVGPRPVRPGGRTLVKVKTTAAVLLVDGVLACRQLRTESSSHGPGRGIGTEGRGGSATPGGCRGTASPPGAAGPPLPSPANPAGQEVVYTKSLRRCHSCIMAYRDCIPMVVPYGRTQDSRMARADEFCCRIRLRAFRPPSRELIEGCIAIERERENLCVVWNRRTGGRRLCSGTRPVAAGCVSFVRRTMTMGRGQVVVGGAWRFYVEKIAGGIDMATVFAVLINRD
jgi:hypothetical protein